MDNQPEVNIYKLSFTGKGIDLFKIQIVNSILTMLTLGLYYPWAKAAKLQYLYSQTIFEDHPLSFTGTGKEMFKGFIKAVLFLLVGYGLFFFLLSDGMKQFALLFFYLFFLSILPIAIHGSYKYRMAKTVWRGIRFGYTGDRKELFFLFLKGIFFTIITLGFYGAWFKIDLRKYVVGHIRIGNAEFRYNGNGAEYFFFNLKGYFLTIFTLGIYSFWWQKDIFNYYVNNLELYQNGRGVMFRSNATGGGYAKLMIGNFFIVILTLGLGFSWAVTRTLTYVANNIAPIGNYSFDELQQAQQDYDNATGDDLADFLDLGFVI